MLAFWLVWAQALAWPAEARDPAVGNDSAALYVVRRGWHIDVAFAAADLEGPLHTVLAKFPGARYLSFGFGDRRYLMANHRGTPAMLKALWPGPGLLLVTGLRATPVEAFGAANVIALKRSREQLTAAQLYIWHSFAQAARAISSGASSGSAASADVQHTFRAERMGSRQIEMTTPLKPMPDIKESEATPEEVAHGPYAGSLYFASRLNYSGVHTCNTWVAETMQQASLPVRITGVIFAGQVWKRSLKIAAADRIGGDFQ